jgi:hypothetical protein
VSQKLITVGTRHCRLLISTTQRIKDKEGFLFLCNRNFTIAIENKPEQTKVRTTNHFCCGNQLYSETSDIIFD